jgi:putative membrane protein
LSANHLEAFFILFALGLNIVSDLNRIFNVDGWAFMDNYAGQIQEQKIIAITILIILISVISIIVSVIRTTIKYYAFTIEDTNRGWKISFGLITRRQNIVPFNKIQYLSWGTNWLRRKLDMWMVHVHSIGHDAVKANQRITIPVTSLQKAIELSRSYQHSPVFEKKDGLGIANSYWKRRTLLIGVPVTVCLAIILYVLSGIIGLWIGLLLPLLAAHYYKWYYNFRWISNEEGLQVYSGVWGRKYQLVAWKKIQQVQFSQGIYQRSHHLANIRIITAGGNINLPYLNYDTAMGLMNKALYYVESREESWM